MAGSSEEGFMKKIYRTTIFHRKVCLFNKDIHKDTHKDTREALSHREVLFH